ncbi:hypothetical protein FRC04_006672 [Tulasnella sp. 424]|nr:hypothetical protein FRC04_006672 [Tulasnella sp. 424]
MSPFSSTRILRNSSQLQSNPPQVAPKSPSSSKSTATYLSIGGLAALLICIFLISRAWNEARKERRLRSSGAPESVPIGRFAGPSETEKEDDNGEEVETPKMYEIYLRDERVEEGMSSGPGWGGWTNMMPLSTSLATLSDAPNAAKLLSDAGQDTEADTTFEIIPLPSSQRSIVTSVFIEMPTPHALDPKGKKPICPTSHGTALCEEQRLPDMAFGVHEVLDVQQPTLTP